MQKITKTANEWRAILSEEAYYITRKKGTERAFSGTYWDCAQQGIYHCICCDAPLFDAADKFDSGTGWPSFFKPFHDENIAQKQDNTLFMRRTEVICNQCDAHLGHVFNDGPAPTGLRYCINSGALQLK